MQHRRCDPFTEARIGTRCRHTASLVQPGGKPRGATPPWYGRFVHERTSATPPGGVVGVECLAEALCGRDGGAHDLRIGGRKREVRGGVRRRDSGNAGHARKGAHFAAHVCRQTVPGCVRADRASGVSRSRHCPAMARSFTAGPPQRPLHTCTRSTLTQTSHALCDIRAIHVGIVRKSCRRGQHATFFARLRQTAPAPYRIFFLRHVLWDIPSVWGLRVGADDRRRPGMAGAHAMRARALVDHPSAPEASST